MLRAIRFTAKMSLITPRMVKIQKIKIPPANYDITISKFLKNYFFILTTNKFEEKTPKINTQTSIIISKIIQKSRNMVNSKFNEK